eukprot:CAMPEP_0194732660 /NCGR_PEP_ID=MMETSP0296-20130528/62362_1 /TAXON_ID=39354 /ORGANISM="Heterosigma akashiwo, Strain CCMP2393" /LENGTH=177 /DNA_ID=CAMNT_0039640665 /DNA_START=718 /DNA_END=1247 /DNA_ORIENTATION=+
MARAVLVVQSVGPQRQPRQWVQLAAQRAFWEYRPGQSNMALKHSGVCPDHLFFGSFSSWPGQPESAGDVGGSIHILRPGVQEQHAARRQRGRRGLLRLVVDDGAVGPEAADGGEGGAPVAPDARAEGLQLRGSARLGQRPPPAPAVRGLQAALEPGQEAGQRGAVADVAAAEALELR